MIDNSSYAISRSVIVRAKEDKKKFKKSKNKKVDISRISFATTISTIYYRREIINFTHRETNENIRKIRRKIVREYSKYLR